MYPKIAAVMRITLACLLYCFASFGRVQAAETYKMRWLTSGNTNIPLIQVGFEDGSSRLFILDAAAYTTTIDRRVATEMRLPIRRAYPNEPARTVDFAVCSVKLGKDVLPLQGVPFVLADLSALRRIDANIVGSIGTNVLSFFTLRMDYSKKQLEMIRGSVKDTVDEPTDAEKLPMTKAATFYKVTGSLDGVKIDFVLSTGAEYTFISEEQILSQLKPKALVSETNVTTAAGSQTGNGAQKATSRLMQFGEFGIGKLTVKDPLVQRTTAGYQVNGMGDDLLKRFRIVIDFPGQTLYLTPETAGKEKAEKPAAAGHAP